jgi:hypothetical protein
MSDTAKNSKRQHRALWSSIGKSATAWRKTFGIDSRLGRRIPNGEPGRVGSQSTRALKTSGMFSRSLADYRRVTTRAWKLFPIVNGRFAFWRWLTRNRRLSNHSPADLEPSSACPYNALRFPVLTALTSLSLRFKPTIRPNRIGDSLPQRHPSEPIADWKRRFMGTSARGFWQGRR